MKLISKVRIEGFRSIRRAAISELGNFTVFAGLNNSGKSNVLRALNAFFNAETDPGRYVDVDDDFYRPDLRKKKRKSIAICVAFDLPDLFSFRKKLEPVEQLLGGRSFEVTKEWTRKQFLPTYYLNGHRLDTDDQQKIDQFLQLINFRYIPNRVLPTEVIRGEHEALRDVLIRRLARRAKEDSAAFDAIRNVSESLIQSVAQRFSESCPTEGKIELGTPTSWHEMVFAFGYRLLKGGVEIDDFLQGSGIQSLLMLETLYLIDRDYFQQFGWRQAAVWGIEEPESSLHSSLEARVAEFLATITGDPKSRLQVFSTSHSDLMLQYAEKAIVVKQQNNESLFDDKIRKREAMGVLSRAGVSRWVHPLLFYPLDPVVLVEGKYDEQFLIEAFKHLKVKRYFRVTFLEKLSADGATGGVDDLLRYIKANKQAISARSDSGPVLVVLDWDSFSKVSQFQKAIGEGDQYKVFIWPENALNPKLGKDFRGIERAYSDRMIKEAVRRRAAIEETTTGRYVVADKNQYGKVKEILAGILQEGLDAQDLTFARTFLEQLLHFAGTSK